MASSRDIINIQSLNELTSEKDLRGQYVVKFSDSLAFVCSPGIPVTTLIASLIAG